MARNNTRSNEATVQASITGPVDQGSVQDGQDTASTESGSNDTGSESDPAGEASKVEGDGSAKRLEVTFDKATRTIGFDGKAYPISDMIEAAIDYAIFNGLKQGTKDAIAGLAPGILGTAKNAKANWPDSDLKVEADKHGLAYPNGFTTSVREQLVTLLEADALRTKFAKIMAGEVSTRNVGPRKIGLEKILDDMVVAQLRTMFAQAKTTFPAGDDLEAYKVKLLAHEQVGPQLRNAAKAEFDRQSASAQTVNLAALMAASQS